MKHLIFIFLIFPVFSFSQDLEKYIEKHAIEIEKLSELSPEVYDSIAHFELIMIGEMHGTKEPAQLVEALAKLILKNEKTISIGLEIPTSKLAGFIEDPTEKTLINTQFFTQENTDGRNDTAWFNLILSCVNKTNINLFFFDNYQNHGGLKRDSIMYLGVKNQKVKFPNSKIITLSGNLHNQRISPNERTTMGMYCLKDTVHFSPNTICSINHVYSEGNMLNNIGNGLELTTINFEESVFSKSIDFKNYLILFDAGIQNSYNCIFYTRQVNHSKKIKN